MKNDRRTVLRAFAALVAISAVLPPSAALSASAAELDAAADATLARLRATEPVSEQMIRKAKGILIFPEIVKGGFLVGGATGEGLLRVKGRNAGIYRSNALSFGLQAGLTKFGYVVFFMDDNALRFAKETQGWEIGTAPNVTIADKGVARRLSSSTLQNGIYVFFLDRKGLFAGAGLEGTKISRIAD